MRTRSILVAASLAALAVGTGVTPAPAAPGHPARTGRPAAATASPSYIVRALNAQRRANGIPAGIRDNGTWNGKCRKHDHYMAVNNVLTHYETKGQPGYTVGGAWAGQNSVIEYGSTWRNGNPYEFAPIHLAQLLQPRLNKTGTYELSSGAITWGCTVTLAGFNRPDPKTNRIDSYPGPGARGVNFLYIANEFPQTPNQLLGIPAATGEQLFVFASGPILAKTDPYRIDITAASLHPKGGGNVKVRIADAPLRFPKGCGAGSSWCRLGNFLGPGAGIVIPVKPLKPSTRYVASVTMRGGGVTLHKTWSFTTKHA